MNEKRFQATAGEAPRTGESRRQGGAVSRRQVLGGALAGIASISLVPRHVLGGALQAAPGSKPALGAVGVGGVGFGQVQACEKAGFQVVALCDVDDEYAKKAFERWPQARRYRDYRELLQAEGDRIDAVYCGTPDHTHALITSAALQAKKHVCCVKPLTRTLGENREILRAAQAAGVATQVTASPNTSESACRTCELIWAGAIGPVRELHVWSNRPLWPQGMLPPEGSDPIPSTLDWNLWIGPAPMRDFKAQWPEGHVALRQIKAAGTKGGNLRAVYHPWNFRGWWDFGTGALGDMGCHHVNTPYRALKLNHPTHVQASATQVFEQTAPLASIVTYDFPAREEMPPCRLVWYDGGLKPPAPRELQGKPLPDSGELYLGDEGAMLESRILSAERAKKFQQVPKTLPRRAGTWGEWYEACTGGEPAGCDFAWSGRLTEFVLLGNIAIRTARPLAWDPSSLRFTGDDEATQHVDPPYENGWKL